LPTRENDDDRAARCRFAAGGVIRRTTGNGFIFYYPML